MNQSIEGCLAITYGMSAEKNNGLIVTVGCCLGVGATLKSTPFNPKEGVIWEINRDLMTIRGVFLAVCPESFLMRIDCDLKEETKEKQEELIV